MTSEQERDNIKRELSTLSCPFTWKLADATAYYKTKISYTKMTDDNIDEEALLHLEKLISCLIILYEKILFSELDRAHMKLDESEQLLLELQDAHEDDDIIKVIEHIFYSTKCHYFFEINNIEQLKIILPTIIKTSEFTNIELAALAGCQSVAWSMYVDYGRKEAIKFAEQALQQNSDKALWHFILAKNLRRERCLIKAGLKPSEEEKQHYELAYKKSPNPTFGMHLARIYREYIPYAPCPQRNGLEKSLLDLYKEILQSSDNNYRILLKLALGFIRLKSNPQPELAKDCLDIVENIVPDHITYLHYRGIYLEHIGNFMEALEFYKKAGERCNYPADMDYVKLSYKVNRVNPLTHFLSMIERYNNISSEKIQEIYLGIATCYYERRDWIHAMEYYLKAIKLDPKNPRLTTPNIMGNIFKRLYKKGIYKFLKLEFLEIARNCEEYRCKDETFITLYNKLQELCNSRA